MLKQTIKQKTAYSQGIIGSRVTSCLITTIFFMRRVRSSVTIKREGTMHQILATQEAAIHFKVQMEKLPKKHFIMV